MKPLQGAALRSYLQKVARENARIKTLAHKRAKLEKMQAAYAREKQRTKLQDAMLHIASYAAIARHVLTIAFHVAPTIAIVAIVCKLLFWLFFKG